MPANKNDKILDAMQKGIPPRDFAESPDVPHTDKTNKVLLDLAAAKGMQEGDIIVLFMEKSPTGGLVSVLQVISAASIKSPISTLRTRAMDLVNLFLKKRAGKL
jgi:hypothetical protein